MSLLIPALLGQPAGGEGGFVPQCYDLSDGTGAYLYSGASALGTSDSNSFTLVMCFEITAGDFAAGENDYLFVSDGNRVRLRLLAYSGASARPIRFNFIAYNYAGEWTGTTVLTLSTAAKHVVAFSYEAGVRKQVYIDGSLSTITGETDTSPVVELTNPITLGADGTHTDFSPKFRFSSFWLKSGTSDDLSTALGNYVSGTTPLDSANGAQVYMKMDNLTSDGSTPTEWTDAGSPVQEDY